MIKINNTLLNNTSEKAQTSERKRMNYNFHKDNSDTFQRFLNALEPGTYIRPHKQTLIKQKSLFV